MDEGTASKTEKNKSSGCREKDTRQNLQALEHAVITEHDPSLSLLMAGINPVVLDKGTSKHF